MICRKANGADLDNIMVLIEQAKAYFKANGIDQWPIGRPARATFEADLCAGKSYVLEKGHQIVATAYLSANDEPAYEVRKAGKWLKDGSYGVIHRVAVDNAYKGEGYAGELLRALESRSKEEGTMSLRIDTHRDNLAMQRLIHKRGFSYCGIVTIEDGSERLAFEKLL